MGGVGALTFAASTGAFAGTEPAFRARRTATKYTGAIAFPPSAVFPLLCPVREYEWIEQWSCEMIYSESGVAEENCIFTTLFGPFVWNVDRYEPPSRISFTLVSAEQVNRLKISLVATASGGTRITWDRIFTGLNDAGNAKIGTWNSDLDRILTEKIGEFLKTGKMPHSS